MTTTKKTVGQIMQEHLAQLDAIAESYGKDSSTYNDWTAYTRKTVESCKIIPCVVIFHRYSACVTRLYPYCPVWTDRQKIDWYKWEFSELKYVLKNYKNQGLRIIYMNANRIVEMTQQECAKFIYERKNYKEYFVKKELYQEQQRKKVFLTEPAKKRISRLIADGVDITSLRRNISYVANWAKSRSCSKIIINIDYYDSHGFYIEHRDVATDKVITNGGILFYAGAWSIHT